MAGCLRGLEERPPSCRRGVHPTWALPTTDHSTSAINFRQVSDTNR